MTTDIDIETYVNSLSNETLSLNIHMHMSKCITYLPDLTRFKNLQILNCSHNQITSLPDLTIFKNLQILNCYNNKLTSLPNLPQSLKILHCSYNKLTSLPDLTGLINLKSFHCDYNQLTSLPSLPPNLEGLYCSCNELTYFPNLPQNIKTLHCFNNHIYNIIGSNDFFKIIKNIQISNNFRYLYYCLKYKKQFRKWLWEKIREPKIMKMYNPRYLLENVKEDDDLDIVLQNWNMHL